ncbi:Uma2 family endonuclease [Oscillatoria salina]|uniref:Uma2 family endonuclease n=1 Tax=Oscillatoria salina TaxID=331517 RepID=UPI001CCE0206|nr:Uma2 family endonuclease [Oscillatoria salina]MBZ8180944.1 Uma2 family endonuclease [Oscillatoria salina IIICB1]
MVRQLQSQTSTKVIYPDSDGQPMADNTVKFRWIVIIKENLELLFADDPNVFIAGDLLWYPVEGDNTIRKAPDVMVVFGRPKIDRGSYQQWLENNLAPQVVFEILSPSNRLTEMAQKLEFYDRYGVEEYYLYDPEKVDLSVWLRQRDRLSTISSPAGWTSPRLGIRFELTADELEIFTPTGERFLSYVQLAQLRKQAEQRAEQAESRIRKLEARLRELGVDPER